MFHLHVPNNVNDIHNNPRPLHMSSTINISTSTSETVRLATHNIGKGLVSKLPSLLFQSTCLHIDVLGLQEIGDPALLQTRFDSHFLICAPGPAQQAGVALMIASRLAPRCRAYKRSARSVGRVVGVVMELRKGKRTLIVSAYMPSGLDHLQPRSSQAEEARDIYKEILQWSAGMDHVVVMGDLNQTLTAADRIPLQSILYHRLNAESPIHNLVNDNYTDSYRLLHPHAPGFTHEIISDRKHVRSRLDYIWTKGFEREEHIHAKVYPSKNISNHHLLVLHLRLQYDRTHMQTHSHASKLCAPPRLYNLTRASAEEVKSFTHLVEKNILQSQDQLHSQAASMQDSPASLSNFASGLTSMVREAAQLSLPTTGGKPFQSKQVQNLERQMRDLISLRHLTHSLMDASSTVPVWANREWSVKFRRCVAVHRLHWSADVVGNPSAWMIETQQHIRNTRQQIRQHIQRMKKQQIPRLNHNPTATVHRMLQSDALPSHLLSVVNKQGNLTTSAEELKEVMVEHFQSVFSLPQEEETMANRNTNHNNKRDNNGITCTNPIVNSIKTNSTSTSSCTSSSPFAFWPCPDMLLLKPSIDPTWYSGLMSDIDEQELLETVRDLPLVSAAGEDGVSSGLWKTAVQQSEITRQHVLTLFNSCLHTSTFPAAWKTSVIVPLIKDPSKERTMSNVRPISLQSCLGKLFSLILTRRLQSCIARHPVLHPSQRGFVVGGTTMKCVDELLDAWQWSREQQKPLYTLLYDIKQAYDSVQVNVLVRALHRIRLPTSFVNLVESSLTNLTSCIRTPYGTTQTFPVLRSIRQGDPLSPLLFVILMDALHVGLDTNPYTNKQHGLHIRMCHRDLYIASLGYADDSGVITNTLEDLHIQNTWVQYFLWFNKMKLNPLKCDLIGRSAGPCNAYGRPTTRQITREELVENDITIDGHIPEPQPHDQSIRYLGIHARFDGKWDDQQNKTLQMISKFTRLVEKFKLPIGQAVSMFNTFLLPKMEMALHYVAGPHAQEWIHQCDRLLVGCIKHAASINIRASHNVVALVCGLRLPSWLEAAIKVCELFIRLNNEDTDRWCQLGRLLMQAQFPTNSVVAKSTSTMPPKSLCGTVRAAWLAATSLGWSLFTDLAPSSTSSDSVRRTVRHNKCILKSSTLSALPRDRADYTLLSKVTLEFPKDSLGQDPTRPKPDHVRETLILPHDLWCGWFSTSHDHRQTPFIDVFTDGSFDRGTMTSSWSLVIGDEWMQHNHGTVPVDEKMIIYGHVAGSSMFGNRIDRRISCGIYPAELQAIGRALALLPLSLRINIVSDSLSSLLAIRSFREQLNPRRRLRSSARPLLLLIDHLVQKRQEVTGDHDAVRLTHVPSHSTSADLNSTGNRMADYCANVARCKERESYPSGIGQLPLEACERHMHIRVGQEGTLMIDDVRRSALIQLKCKARFAWCAKYKDKLMGRFASATAGVEELGRIVMRHANSSPSVQSTLLQVVTNSIHLVWSPLPEQQSQATQVDHDDQASQSTQTGTRVRACLHELTCTHCHDEPMTIDHFAICPHVENVRLRGQMQDKLIDLLRDAATRDPRDANWFEISRGQQLLPFLQSLFQPARVGQPVPEKDGVTLMIGAWTAAEANQALAGTPLGKKEYELRVRGKCEMEHPVNRMRLALLGWVGQVFARFKQQLQSSSRC
jgi:exonuclease III/ribonuclease HI